MPIEAIATPLGTSAAQPASRDFAVFVDGAPVAVLPARVSAQPFNQVWPGYQRPLEQTEIAWFASWDMALPVELEIRIERSIDQIRIRPSAAGVQSRLEGNTLYFRLENPGQFTVEVNGTHQALHLFANPPETGAPQPGAAGICYFGPGEHFPGLITLKSHETLYLAEGAVVYGAVWAENAKGISIRGRGILDGSRLDRMDETGLIAFFNCENVEIEGIVLRDPSGWTVVPISSENVRIRNLKLIGNWRYNTDGIDFVSCRHCSVEDSFVRAFDDCICLKGYEHFGPFIYRLQIFENRWDGTFTLDGVTNRPFSEIQDTFGRFRCDTSRISDIQVRRCVLWNDWGRALEIGAETTVDEIHDILFEDCDVIHATHIALDVQNSDRAYCHHITFQNIRVEMDDDLPQPRMQKAPGEIFHSAPGERHLASFLVLENVKNWVSYDVERGRIEDITFRDISLTAPSVPDSSFHGFDAGHTVTAVTLENVRINGRLVTTLGDAGIRSNEFVTGVTFGPGTTE